MYDDSIQLIELPEHDAIAVCVYIENEGLLALGHRIHTRFSQVDMHGYNWDALIRFYVGKVEPRLMRKMRADPEAGLYSACLTYSPNNLEKMERFESPIRTLLSDEDALLTFIEEHLDEIEWS